MTVKDIRPALRAFLLSDTTLSMVIGGARVYPAILPQGQTQPSVVYNVISEITDHHMLAPSGLVTVRMQIDAWSLSHDQASNLASLIKDRIDGNRSRWEYGSGSPKPFVQVQGVFAQSARYVYDDSTKLQCVSRDYFLTYAER